MRSYRRKGDVRKGSLNGRRQAARQEKGLEHEGGAGGGGQLVTPSSPPAQPLTFPSRLTCHLLEERGRLHAHGTLRQLSDHPSVRAFGISRTTTLSCTHDSRRVSEEQSGVPGPSPRSCAPLSLSDSSRSRSGGWSARSGVAAGGDTRPRSQRVPRLSHALWATHPPAPAHAKVERSGDLGLVEGRGGGVQPTSTVLSRASFMREEGEARRAAASSPCGACRPLAPSCRTVLLRCVQGPPH